jgi:multiple sugar transport system substrate-binding protein
MARLFTSGLIALLAACAPPPAADGITFVTMKPDQKEVWDEAFAQFRRAHPAIPLRLQIAPRSSTQYHDLLSQKLKNRDRSVDVMLIDVTWPPGFASAGWIRPLDDVFPVDARAAFLEGPIAANTFAGRIYGVPSRVDAGMLYYRRDLLERHGFAPPTTWPELVRQAHAILGAERPAQPALAGYSTQLKQYEGLVCNLLELIGSNGGALVAAAPGGPRAAVDSPAAVEAVRFARDEIVGALAPRGTLAYEESESLSLFVQGLAVFHRNWPYAWDVANNPTSSRVAGRVGVTALPAFAGHPSVSTLGGYQYAISAHSLKAREAWTFVAFMTSREMQKYFAVRGRLAPALTALYDDPDVLAANPQFVDQRASFVSARPRPSTPLYPMVSNVLQRYFSRALAGAEPIGPLASSAAAEVNAVLALVPSDLAQRLRARPLAVGADGAGLR